MGDHMNQSSALPVCPAMPASRLIPARRARGFLRVSLWAFMMFVSAAARPEAMLQLFNHSWNEVAEKMPEIAEAGYTSLWLPPPTKGNGGFSIGYDLFDPFDL